jgi:hypothetical protein
MDRPPKLSVAIIESTPPLRIYVEGASDAEALANLTGCRVKVEQTYEPESRRGKRRSPTATGNGTAPAVTEDDSAMFVVTELGLPEKVRQRINAEPNRAFRVGDFLDLGDRKRINGILYRLAVEQRQIERTRNRGEFRALRSARPPVKKPAEGATAAPKVLMFMHKHVGEWLGVPVIAQGMGIEEQAGALRASLDRLAKKKVLWKDGGAYCAPREGQEAQH